MTTGWARVGAEAEATGPLGAFTARRRWKPKESRSEGLAEVSAAETSPQGSISLSSGTDFKIILCSTRITLNWEFGTLSKNFCVHTQPGV